MSSSSKPIISLREVSHTYPSGINALQNISVDINKGACVIVTGPSGSCKTSLLKVMRGEISPTLGDVLIHDFNINHFTSSDKVLLRQTTGYIDQDPQFLDTMTIKENLLFYSEISSIPQPNIKKLLEKINLDFALDMYPKELSRGQRQVVQALREVLHKPFLLIADEPIAHLDENYVMIVLQLMKELQNSGTTLLIATHRIDPFTTFPQRTHIQLNKGRLM